MMLHSLVDNMFRTLELEGADSSKQLVTIYQITRPHIPEKCNINIHWHKKSSDLVQVKV
jgi:uncharacterized protein (UPF0333 family)